MTLHQCVFEKKKKVKPFYTSYVYICALNIMMKALKELFKIPLYKDAKGLIKK
jgi:hypothetical protein